MVKLSHTLQKMTYEELMSLLDKTKELNDAKETYTLYKTLLSCDSAVDLLQQHGQSSALADIYHTVATKKLEIGLELFAEENYLGAMNDLTDAVEKVTKANQCVTSPVNQARCMETTIKIRSHQINILARDILSILNNERYTGLVRFQLYLTRLSTEFTPIKLEFDGLLQNIARGHKKFFTKAILNQYQKTTLKLIETIDANPYSEFQAHLKRTREAEQAVENHKKMKVISDNVLLENLEQDNDLPLRSGPALYGFYKPMAEPLDKERTCLDTVIEIDNSDNNLSLN